jgi:hypothetical protein
MGEDGFYELAGRGGLGLQHMRVGAGWNGCCAELQTSISGAPQAADALCTSARGSPRSLDGVLRLLEFLIDMFVALLQSRSSWDTL